MNTFGIALKVSTFGESHGRGIGCVIDGMPSGLFIDEQFISTEMQRRMPGRNTYATARKESDNVEILSGVFEGKSTGTPIALWIANENQRSKDYTQIAHTFRPSHADWTYYHKYGFRDYRGGGRSSARESAARVAAGAFAKLFLKEIGIVLQSGIFQIGALQTEQRDFNFAQTSDIYALDATQEPLFKQAIKDAKKQHDSIGGAAEIRAYNLPIGLGEPLYYKLDAALSSLLMGLNGVKAVEIGTGTKVAATLGSINNDEMTKDGFCSNNSGGILGGISNGDTLIIRAYFKPTPSIFKAQQTLNENYDEILCELKGRHDPCIAIRGSIVAESLVALVLADMALLNISSQMQTIKDFYQKQPYLFTKGD